MCSSFRLKRVNDELTGHEKIESFYGSNKKGWKIICMNNTLNQWQNVNVFWFV